MPAMIYRARVETRSGTFEAFARREDRAMTVLLSGLGRFRRHHGLRDDWADQYHQLIECTAIELGGCTYDGAKI